MKVSYDVVWREADAELAGRLAIGPHSLLLLTAPEEKRAIERELRYEEIAAAELRPGAEETSHPTVALTSREGREVEIASVVDRWIVRRLLERVLLHRLGGGRGTERIVVALKLRAGCRDAARELLRAGPPFNPANTALALHDAFLLEDEVLFLFESHERLDLVRFSELDLWRAAAAWRELTTGHLHVAEQAYSWAREESEAERVPRPGLGF
jgi:hypothetical protein